MPEARRALAGGEPSLESIKRLLLTLVRERYQEQRLRYRELESRATLIQELLGDAAALVRREACETILRVREVLGD